MTNIFYIEPLILNAYSRTSYPKIEEPLVDRESLSLPFIGASNDDLIAFGRITSLSRIVSVSSYVYRDALTRSPLIQTQNVKKAFNLCRYIEENEENLKSIANGTTRYGKTISVSPVPVGKNVYLRLKMHCGESAGSIMICKAAESVIGYIKSIKGFEDIEYSFRSKGKFGAIDVIEGRGKSVVTSLKLPKTFLDRISLTPEELVNFNGEDSSYQNHLDENLFSPNAFYRYVLDPLYNATGQCDIQESSVGKTELEVTKEGDLSVQTILPCLIVGTKGEGKEESIKGKCLEDLGCLKEEKQNGYNSQRLAAIVGAFVSLADLDRLLVRAKSEEYFSDFQKKLI